MRPSGVEGRIKSWSWSPSGVELDKYDRALESPGKQLLAEAFNSSSPNVGRSRPRTMSLESSNIEQATTQRTRSLGSPNMMENCPRRRTRSLGSPTMMDDEASLEWKERFALKSFSLDQVDEEEEDQEEPKLQKSQPPSDWTPLQVLEWLEGTAPEMSSDPSLPVVNQGPGGGNSNSSETQNSYTEGEVVRPVTPIASLPTTVKAEPGALIDIQAKWQGTDLVSDFNSKIGADGDGTAKVMEDIATEEGVRFAAQFLRWRQGLDSQKVTSHRTILGLIGCSCTRWGQ